mmetsp:Transcript_70125/g.197845  ORF Transcript_70125/g.197845 Transcript_70125/m.197845 type:complete len:482 (+) Transcript_70125:892-2337(+)
MVPAGEGREGEGQARERRGRRVGRQHPGRLRRHREVRHCQVAPRREAQGRLLRQDPEGVRDVEGERGVPRPGRRARPLLPQADAEGRRRHPDLPPRLGRHREMLHTALQVRRELQADRAALAHDPGAAARGLREAPGGHAQDCALHEHRGGVRDDRRRHIRHRHGRAEGAFLRPGPRDILARHQDGHEGERHTAARPRRAVPGGPRRALLPELQVRQVRGVPHPPDAVVVHGGGGAAVQGHPRGQQLGDRHHAHGLHGRPEGGGGHRGGVTPQGHELPHAHRRAHGARPRHGGDPRAAERREVPPPGRGVPVHQARGLHRGLPQHQVPLPADGGLGPGQQDHGEGLLQQGVHVRPPHEPAGLHRVAPRGVAGPRGRVLRRAGPQPGDPGHGRHDGAAVRPVHGRRRLRRRGHRRRRLRRCEPRAEGLRRGCTRPGGDDRRLRAECLLPLQGPEVALLVPRHQRGGVSLPWLRERRLPDERE